MSIGRIILLVVAIIGGSTSFAQDTLPRFSATTRGNNRIVISWTNTYQFVSQISIQRSADSTKNFKTILTVPDPTVPQNGFVDAKAPANNLFYRLFIVLDSGKYVFTASKRAFWDTASIKKEVAAPLPVPVKETRPAELVKEPGKPEANRIKEKPADLPKPVPPTPVVVPEPEKFLVIVKKDTVLGTINEKSYKRFRDSVVYKTRDTILFKTVDTVQIRPFVPKEVYRPSKYVYAERDGNIAIALPDAASKKYLIRFFDEKSNFLFEVKKIKENFMYLDKANFQRSGWFKFELTEDGKTIEKHRFFIPKDF